MKESDRCRTNEFIQSRSAIGLSTHDVDSSQHCETRCEVVEVMWILQGILHSVTSTKSLYPLLTIRHWPGSERCFPELFIHTITPNFLGWRLGTLVSVPVLYWSQPFLFIPIHSNVHGIATSSVLQLTTKGSFLPPFTDFLFIPIFQFLHYHDLWGSVYSKGG